ncbi:unnamed protein product [Nippostrongylus brasiliensis]|uniref:COesterase domain-containing protein n=1 Tax=Nippostrongylus brasiliensis TaxID=27835 RepID=A0A0N4XQF9_NIPBR|nr:unnamed protein product [Nippostrongylus brasiliensis]
MGQGTSSRQANVTGDSRQVKTKYGSVVGRRFGFGEKEVDAFQGIPFAKPPVGDLRFKKPIPPVPWEGIRETKKFAARGIQKDMSLVEKTKSSGQKDMSLFTFIQK